MAVQTVLLKNSALAVEISSFGAELQSVKKRGVEYLWNGDPGVWADRAPVLFPICGSLKGGKYEYQGREYFLGQHGFASKCHFEIEDLSEDRAVFLLKSTEETRKSYPFDFELRVCYALVGNAIDVAYLVTNKTDGEMYFSIGAHEGYFCPEGIEDYTLCFAQKENLLHTEVCDGLLSRSTRLYGQGVNCLPLKYSYFDEDALVFLQLKSRSVTLKNGSRQIRVDFEGFDTLLLWTETNKYGKYICIEPWHGMPDYVDAAYDFPHKPGIHRLGRGERDERRHRITLQN